MSSEREKLLAVGHASLRGVFPPQEVRLLAEEVSRIVRDQWAVFSQDDDRPHKPFIQIFNLHKKSAAVRAFLASRTFDEIAKRTLGGPVRLIHDQALFKEPGDSESLWHVDQHYWPTSTHDTCSLWLPLQDTPVEMGPVRYASRSHLISTERKSSVAIPEEDTDRWLRALIAEHRLPIVEEELMLGDVSVHQGTLFHGAGVNGTQQTRGALVLHLIADGARFAAPINVEQDGHCELFGWRGLQPDDLLTDPLCPRVGTSWTGAG